MQELITLLATHRRVSALMQRNAHNALVLAETVHNYERTAHTQQMLDNARRRYDTPSNFSHVEKLA